MNALTVDRWLPRPAVSGALFLTWLWLNASFAPGHIVLGLVFALGLPLATRRLWPEPVTVGRWQVAARFAGRVLWDIIVANIAVSRLVLGPVETLRPGFVEVPLDLDDDFAITVLASTVSLTPGSVSVALSADRKRLWVHALRVDDESELVRTIKERYEALIKEIFRC